MTDVTEALMGNLSIKEDCKVKNVLEKSDSEVQKIRMVVRGIIATLEKEDEKSEASSRS